MSITTEVKITQDKTFETIRTALNKLVDFVRPTYGPASNKAIISKVTHGIVVDDGVQIARDFELEDASENAVVKLVREAAIKTNDRVGDGTTSSLIMLQAIVNEAARMTRRDGRKLEIELKRGMAEARSQILGSALPISTKEELKKVALVAFDNERIAEVLADTYHKLGRDGVIMIDKSPTMDTTVETTDGVKIERGYISPYMITNPERMEAVLEKPYILITDYRILETNDIFNLMDALAKENKRELVVICENMESSALATAVVNKLKGQFVLVAINLPRVPDRKVFLEDLALLTGGRLFTVDKGDKLENAKVEELGRAERFVCRREESIIVGPKGNQADVMAAAANLRLAAESETDEKKKKDLVYRMGMFGNKIAVVKVGAPTDNEQRALKYKVEDAVNALKVAFRGGVVCGSGLTLARIKTTSPILNEALQYPYRQLFENMGLDPDPSVGEGGSGPDQALNVVTGQRGNFLEVGVVDPAEVLVAGVESAVSIASMLLTSHGIIAEAPKKIPIAES